MSNAKGFPLKGIITAAFLFMAIGILMELYLLGHHEDTQQLIPILCIAASLLLAWVLFFQPTRLLQRLFKVVLGLTALSGVYGTYLHLLANYEFEQEMAPGAERWELFMESLSGALPALAPASMIVLALIGYSYLILLKQKQ
ncbi:hypothetical protein [Robiginitalea sp. IMCC43444]|uniref:hypothetical protein n=1 Tax=Robiginitalea sp. IMCC43444 TaxID=3459121 RepID=UPI004041B367